jgi:hypothetical protein
VDAWTPALWLRRIEVGAIYDKAGLFCGVETLIEDAPGLTHPQAIAGTAVWAWDDVHLRKVCMLASADENTKPVFVLVLTGDSPEATGEPPTVSRLRLNHPSSNRLPAFQNRANHRRAE